MAQNKVLGIIFSNMHDQMLTGLTELRTTASVPFGGRYRIVDFPLSNMVNSGITEVGIITKSNYQSLMDHVGNGKPWDLARKRGGLTILPPFSRPAATPYRGRLDGLNGVRSYIHHTGREYLLFADCDIIANISFDDFIDRHIRSQADITVMYKRDTVDSENASDTTVLGCDGDGRLNDVVISPRNKQNVPVFLNIAIMSMDVLDKILDENIGRNQFSFAQHVLMCFKTLDIRCYEFSGHCRRVLSLNKFFNANMELLQPEVRAELFRKSSPIYTKVRDEAAVRYGLEAAVSNSFLADGCVIEGTVENCILFRGVRISKGAVVRNSILMQGTRVEENATLDYLIADKDVTFSAGRRIMGFATYPVYIAKASKV